MRRLTTLDLAPAAAEVTRLAGGLRADQLEDPTPCAAMTVRQLLAHLLLAAHCSAAAASGAPPVGEDEVAVRDDSAWRPVLAQRCAALAAAWADPRAWLGTSAAGGVETSALEAGRVAAMELVLHGWDLAVATGQGFTAEEEDAAAPLLHHALGLSRRDPTGVVAAERSQH